MPGESPKAQISGYKAAFVPPTRLGPPALPREADAGYRLPPQLCGNKFVKKKVLTIFWRFSNKGRLHMVFHRVLREKLNSATMSTYEKALHFTIHVCPP
jgi:hypothetical protein